MSRAKIRKFLEEYAKHGALNLGQALQGVRYVYSHPDIDEQARRGGARHLALSLWLRSRRIGNDLFFAVIPPHWHHSPEELQVMTGISARRWFQYGYCAWRFDDSGAPKRELPPDVDRRWDPRCQRAEP
ncbi:MAG TPA: hypothetical protein VEQ58_08855 [Polyangiaceae bacterium]|nr:hypothetical protein [Polyangiaceae bacterium]